MTNQTDYLNLLQQMDTDTTILTPNRRLSATLHKLYQAQQIDQGKQCWLTPDILPLSSWIQRLWHEATLTEFTTAPLLLNPIQEQFLWEHIIGNAKESEWLLQVSETAEIAKSAWNVLQQWQVSIDHPLFQSAEDYTALQNWTKAFLKTCNDNAWLDNASLPDYVAEKIARNIITPSKRIVLTGFTELSPQIKKILANCAAAGSHIIETVTETSHEEQQYQRISLSDAENEILTMARWAKSRHQKNPGARIGCVIPDLDKIRDRVMQLFASVFAEENTFTVNLQACPFNISAGKSLSQYPIIHAALQLLALHKKIIPLETFGYVLASPFTGNAEKERVKRALFDVALRKHNIINIDLTVSTQTSDVPGLPVLENKCPRLSAHLANFLARLNELDTHYSYHAWATIFTELLTLCGWPGERSLNSEEYQIVECWLNLLTEYGTLDQVSKPVTLTHALKVLHKLVSKTVFQPKTPEAPIQVLGILEAAALPFDELWIAGMDDLSWPPQPKPNPFIPKRLQRELQMPHATAERELMFCNILIQQFQQSAGHVIFSHAKKEDELELQASPLIRNLVEMNVNDLSLEPYHSPSERIYRSKQLESFQDDLAPAVNATEKIRGGVNVIQHQSLCPFKAFAEWRLHARELESPLPGLRSKDRGSLIHTILEKLWNQLQDHATLVAMDDNALHELINSTIAEVFSLRPNARSTHVNYLALEKHRLNKLIYDWLQVEKQRPPFRVLFNEKREQITLNQLTLDVVIDRIDSLPDDSKFIIDYKTGKNNDTKDWFSDRPEALQLPLYALIDPDRTAGIAFAQLFPGKHTFLGASHRDLEIKNVKSMTDIKKAEGLSWSSQLTEWQSVLIQLSDDFMAGKANVDPKHPTKTCQYCALKPCCRIYEESYVCDDNESESA